VPRPPYWGGYRLVPDEVELWQGRPSRLHDRFRYRRADDAWVLERLAPSGRATDRGEPSAGRGAPDGDGSGQEAQHLLAEQVQVLQVAHVEPLEVDPRGTRFGEVRQGGQHLRRGAGGAVAAQLVGGPADV